jgi:serine/threonine-protein kinase
MSDVLYGLQAAHTTNDARGEPLLVVHRDVSPQNVLVGVDGVARVLDFGVAKALGRMQTTRDGQVKGKLGYMAPEQLDGRVTLKTDIYAASVVLWEMLAGRRLYLSDEPGEIIKKIVQGQLSPPSEVRRDIPPALDAVVMRGLALDPERRFESAGEMADTLRRVVAEASPSDVGTWVQSLARKELASRTERIAQIESGRPWTRSFPESGSMRALTSGKSEASRGREPGQATGSMSFGAPQAEDVPTAVDGPTSRVAPERARSAWGMVLVAAVAAIALVGALAAVHRARRDAAPSVAPPLEATAAEGPRASAAPFPAEPPAATDVTASLPVPPPVAPSATVSAGTTASVPPRPRYQSPKPPKANKPDCNPAYREVVIGSKVRRVPKVECL